MMQIAKCSDFLENGCSYAEKGCDVTIQHPLAEISQKGDAERRKIHWSKSK